MFDDTAVRARGPVPLLFAAIDIKDRLCVIVGGGSVADRKARKLVLCGARVTVIAPFITDGLLALQDDGAIAVKKRRYETGDLTGAFMTVIATDDEPVNMRVLKDAAALNILVNAAFSREHGNVIFTAAREMEGFIVSALSRELTPKESLRFLNDLCVNVNTK